MDNIKYIIDYMNTEEDELQITKMPVINIDKAVEPNFIHGVKYMSNSNPILKSLFIKGDTNIVGAIYHVENDKVEFLGF